MHLYVRQDTSEIYFSIRMLVTPILEKYIKGLTHFSKVKNIKIN